MNVDFLAGLRVLELGDGVSGAAAAGILAALGADVTAVIDPKSPHRQGQPRVASGDNASALLGACLDRGKALLRMTADDDPSKLLKGQYDLVLVDRVNWLQDGLGPLRHVGEYLDFVQRHNAHAWLTISAFGLTGPRAGHEATELSVAAASGMLAAVRDEATGLPLKLGGQQSLLNAGQAAALAACHALDLAIDGAPVHLDLSAVEATLAMGPFLEVGGFLLTTGGGGGARRYGAPASFYPCKDGLVRISAMEDHQWQGVVATMGLPALATRFGSAASRIEAAAEVDEAVGAWTKTKTKRDAETELQAHGVPATAVYSPTEILDSPQLAHRHTLESLPLPDGRTATVAGLPFGVVSGGNVARPDLRRRRSLRGLRIIEASRVLAVPLAGAILGVLGADVSKLEDLPRLDMYRRRGPYVDGEAGPERSAYFALVNHTKGSVALDVDADRARLDELVASADVVMENLGHKRATAVGIAASVAPLQHPNLLAVSSSGFGQDGPYASYRAYAYNLQASGALGYLTRSQAGESAEIDIAWADLISAYALATIVAAWAVGPMGNTGAGVDFAMTDLVVSHFNEFLAAASLGYDDVDNDRANDLVPYAPHGVYPTADGWIVIAVRTDDEFSRLVKSLGSEWIPASDFSTASGRLDHRHSLDAEIAQLTKGFSASELAFKLRAEGVLAEEVVDAKALTQDAQLLSREFFPAVEHPKWGSRRLVGLPWRVFGQSAPPFGAPPLLGQPVARGAA